MAKGIKSENIREQASLDNLLKKTQEDLDKALKLLSREYENGDNPMRVYLENRVAGLELRLQNLISPPLVVDTAEEPELTQPEVREIPVYKYPAPVIEYAVGKDNKNFLNFCEACGCSISFCRCGG